jgi:hypothetical protein
MSKPKYWIKSNKIKAIPVFISGDWITLVDPKDTDLSSTIVEALQLHKTTAELWGTRKVIGEDEWSLLDSDSYVVPFSQDIVSYADIGTPRLTPEVAELVLYVSQLSLDQPKFYVSLHADVDIDIFWQALENNDIDRSTVDAWENFKNSYNLSRNNTPEVNEFMQPITSRIDALHGITKTENINLDRQISTVEDQVIAAVAGQSLSYHDADGEVVTAILANSVFVGDTTVTFENEEPFWVNNNLIHQRYNVPRESVIFHNTLISKRRHPIPIPESFTAWVAKLPHRNTIENIDGYRQHSGNEEFDTMIEVRDYIRGELDQINSSAPTLIYYPYESKWGMNSDDVKSVTDLVSEFSSDYTHAVTLYRERVEMYVTVNTPILERLQTITGLAAAELMQPDHATHDGSTIRDVAQSLAISRVRLDENGWLNRTIGLSASLKLTPVVRFVLDDNLVTTGSVYLFRAADDRYFSLLAGRNNNSSLIVADAIAKNTFITFDSIQESVSNAVEQSGITPTVERLGAINKAAMILPKAVNYLERSVTSNESSFSALYEHTKNRLALARSLSHCSTQWINSTARGFAEEQSQMLGLRVVAITKSRVSNRMLPEADIWNVHSGDRDAARDAVIYAMKSVRGMKSADYIIIDSMEALSPELRISVSEIFSSRRSNDAQASSNRGEKRSDVGYVAGYARKDLYQLKTGSLSTAIGSMSPDQKLDLVQLSKIWPTPKWAAMRDLGISAKTAFAIDYARKSLPNKFSTADNNDESLSQYVIALRLLRADIMEETEFVRVVDRVRDFYHDIGIKENSAQINAYNGDSILGKLGPRWAKCARKNFYNLMFDDKDRVTDLLTNLHAYTEHKDQSGWGFLPKGRSSVASRTRRSLQGFPNLEVINREGPDWRSNKNVSEEDLIRTFGLSGVEYGQWTNQNEREKYLTLSFDAFADLAEAVSVPKNAIGFGGELGLTYGSRGRGGIDAPAAHYERENIAIALTRKNGIGALGHEYFHALAANLSRLHTPSGTIGDYAETQASIIKRRANDQRANSSDNTYSGSARENLHIAFEKLYMSLTRQPKEFSSIRFIDDIIIENFTDDAAWVKSSQEQDKIDRRPEPYWSSPSELFARGMEVWLLENMKSNRVSNDYLVSAARIGLSQTGEYPVYPTGVQMEIVKLAADNFFGELRTEQRMINHHIGEALPVSFMYSRTGDVHTMPREILAQQTLHDIRKIIGTELPLLINNKLKDTEGNAVSGLYDPVLKLIGLADGFAGKEEAHHEIFHAAKDLILNNEEISRLDSTFEKGSPAHAALVDYFKLTGKNYLVPYLDDVEEAQAYAFQLHSTGKMNFSGFEKEDQSLMQRLVDLIKSILEAIKGNGFERSKSIFDALEAGDLAHRNAMMVIGEQENRPNLQQTMC